MYRGEGPLTTSLMRTNRAESLPLNHLPISGLANHLYGRGWVTKDVLSVCLLQTKLGLEESHTGRKKINLAMHAYFWFGKVPNEINDGHTAALYYQYICS